MVRTMLSAAFAAVVSLAPASLAPVQAQDLGDIVGGVARQYLQQEQDRAAFAQAQATDTRAGYQSYLRQFPNGAYAAQARDRVRQLGGTVAAPGQAQGDTAGLTRQQRVQIQQRLNTLGYSTNGADGTFGPGTRRAIGLWQRDRNYAQTGTLSTAQANEILRGTASAGPATPTAAASVGPAGTEADLGLGREQRRAVQAGLTRRGFDTRGVDGVFGQGTRNAIAAWQRANDFQATGYLTAVQYDRLIAR